MDANLNEQKSNEDVQILEPQKQTPPKYNPGMNKFLLFYILNRFLIGFIHLINSALQGCRNVDEFTHLNKIEEGM